MRTTRGLIAIVVLAASTSTLLADNKTDAKAEVDFGVTCAQKGLWKEAVFRWKTAVEKDPAYAQAWNDLGIGYEELGKFDDARKAYEKAMAVDPNNAFIRQNYEEFRQIYDKQNRRRDK